MNLPRFESLLRPIEVATLIALGMAIGGALSEGLAFEEWLYRWSTLIAGVLAVSAAAITVNAMMATDKRQQRRHEELMKLNLRSERLVAMRAATPWSDFLRIWGSRYQRAMQMLANFPDSPQNRKNIFSLAEETNRAVFDALKSETLTAVRPLLDARAYHAIDTVITRIDVMNGFMIAHFNGELEGDALEQNKRSLSNSLLILKTLLDDVALHLETLSKSYD